MGILGIIYVAYSVFYYEYVVQDFEIIRAEVVKIRGLKELLLVSADENEIQTLIT